MRPPPYRAVLTLLASALLLSACAGQGATTDDPATVDASTEDSDTTTGDGTTLTLLGADGAQMGTVQLSEVSDGLRVQATVEGLPGGDFHGFHFHETADCDPDDPEGPFMSAGGHLNPDGDTHADHAGDMPPLLARDDGTASAQIVTDRVTLDELRAGAALIVHADRDNQGNIPDRYTAEDADTPGPDEDTLATGDAGDRLACAVVE